MPLIASATGLGKLNVFSALGEPLNAEIELLSVTPEELASLTASLASEEQYAAQGIDKSAIQQNIKASISKKPNGSSVIHLTSSQVVNDPFLDMLIQVVWSNGQFSREYTLLLDPPEYSVANVSSPVVETTKTVTAQTMMKQDAPSPAPQVEITSKTKTHKAATKTARAKSSDTTSSVPDENTVTTAKGDSLSAIALRLQVQDVDLDQLLLGLYKANPDAFEGGNINRLKVGQVIHVPTAEVLQSISKDDAKAEVRAQTANWHGYATKLSDAVAHSEASDSANSNQSSGKVATKAEDKAFPVADGPRDVVKLAKTETAKTSDASSSQSESKSSEQVTSNMQDDLAAKENTIKETDEKSAALEKQIADMKQLLAIKNKNMAEAQKAAKDAKSPGLASVLFLSLSAALLSLLVVVWLWVRNKRKVRSQSEMFAEELNADMEVVLNQNSVQNLSGFVEDVNQDVPGAFESEITTELALKPLEMDLTGIDLSFESIPQFGVEDTAQTSIPDAFNGDFSNLLKAEIKPQQNASAQQASAPKKTNQKAAKKNKSDGAESSEVATKIELAVAYIDMADKEGALELLAEALKEGGPQQRERAQALIDSLA